MHGGVEKGETLVEHINKIDSVTLTAGYNNKDGNNKASMILRPPLDSLQRRESQKVNSKTLAQQCTQQGPAQCIASTL